MTPEMTASLAPGGVTSSAPLFDYDPGVWTCSSDQDIRAMIVAQDVHLEKATKRPSILKHRDNSTVSQRTEEELSEDGEQVDTRGLLRGRRSREGLIAGPSGSARAKSEVTFKDTAAKKKASVVRSGSKRPATANRALAVHQERLLKFRRPHSAPTILMSTDEGGEPHIYSMTLYMDDYQHPGRTTMLTLSYSKSNMANARLLSTDITRYAKRREGLMQHNIRQTENRLHAQRIRREERLRQKEDEIIRLKKLELEATQRYRLVARAPAKIPKKREATLLTVSEREQFRRSMIRRRTSLMPGTSANWRKFVPDAYSSEELA